MGLPHCKKCHYFALSMLKGLYLKISLLALALFICVGLALAKFDLFSNMSYSPSALSILPGEELKTEANSQKEMEDEGSSSEYFSIFKLINSFIPDKKEN